jgi:hypothetical protein
MERRALLATLGASAFAGCSGVLNQNSVQDSDGDGVIDSEDYAPNDADVQEKSDVTGGSSSGSSNNNGSGSDSPNNQSSDDSGNDGPPNQQQRQNVVDTYNNGLRATNNATSTLDSAVSSFNNDNLQQSINQAGNAQSTFETGETRFSNAYDTALQLDSDEAQTICETAQRYAGLMAEAALESKRAAEAAQNGNTEKSNEHVNEHQSLVREAEKQTPRATTVLADVLEV